jgi:hypothetical protein
VDDDEGDVDDDEGDEDDDDEGVLLMWMMRVLLMRVCVGVDEGDEEQQHALF